MQHENPHGGETLRQAVITQPGQLAANDLIDLEAQIPFYKYGGRLIMFDRAALETWRAARLQAVPTQAEAAASAAAYCAAKPLR